MKTEETLFIEAAEIPNPVERCAYLDRACAGDAALRDRLERLLDQHGRAGSFLGHSPAGSPDTANFVPGEESTRTFPSASQNVGALIGPYKLLQQIGEGGMGTVFMAEQMEPVKRKVALKVIKAGMDSRQVIARFEAERQALAMMDHVNIARVFDAGTTEAGRPYFVMELVHGVPITKYCDDHHLTPRERLELFVPVCQAIQHAHQKGIIHRDIKPSNVIVTLYDGKPVPKVIDFGVAKATEQKLTERTLFTQFGAMIGTLEYMSPEQAEMSALGVDTRSDIYSLGVLLYELLTGSTPLSRKRMKEAAYAEILRRIKEEEPPKPSTRLSDSGEALASISAQRKTEPAKLSKLMRGELDWIVMKTLEKDRNRRYETAKDFAADVQRYLNDETVQACPPSVGYRLRKFMRRNKGPVVAASVILVCLVGGVTGTSMGLIWAVRERDDKATALAAETIERQDKEKALAAEIKEREDKERALVAETKARKAEHQAREKAMDVLRAMTDAIVENQMARGANLTEENKEFLRKIIKHFEGFAAVTADDAESRAIRAEGYLPVGSMRHRLGELKEAQNAYVAALALFKQLAAEFPTLFSYRQNLASSHNNLGALLVSIGKWGEAEAAFHAALTIREKLAADFPTVPADRQQLASSHYNLGVLLAGLGKRGEAEAAFHAARTIQEKLAADFPTVPAFRQDLAKNHGSLGVLLVELGKRGEAEAAFHAALTIQAKLAADSPTVPEYRQDLAMSHHSLGNLLKDLDKRGEAEAAGYAALTIREKLAADFPTVPTYRQDVAMSHNSLGLLLAGLGKRREAEAAFRAAQTIQEKLAADFPTVPAYRQALARSHNNLGVLLAELGRRSEAEAECRAARTIQVKLAADFPTVPEYRRELALSHIGLGGLLDDLGKRGETEAAFHAARTIQVKLAADFPTVPEYRRELALSHIGLGGLLDDLGKRGDAEAEYRAALTIQEKLAADFPTVPEYRRELADSHNNLGVLLAGHGKWGEAEAEYRADLTISEKLAADFPGVPNYQIGLGGSYCNLGNLRGNQGRQQDALAEYAKAIRSLEVWVKDKRLVMAREFARNAFIGRAQALTQLKRYAEAVPDWARAIELDDCDSKIKWRVQRAVTLIHSGDHARAVAEANALAAEKNVTGTTLYDAACVLSIASSVVKQDAKLQEQYAVRAVELLTLAEGRGFFKDARNIEGMNKDIDLEPLRRRQDYKKLLAELGAKK